MFPGGCFFAGMLAEFDAQEGRPHDEVAADQREWTGLVRTLAHQARGTGELDEDADLEQLVFDLTAAVEHANYYYVLFHDPDVLARARTAVDAAITRARPVSGSAAIDTAPASRDPLPQ